MTYEIPHLDEDPTDEDLWLEVLEYLVGGCRLSDLVSKDAADVRTVREHDYPGFSANDGTCFDYPEADVLNGMMGAGLLTVHVSPAHASGVENPHWNLRRFLLTDEGRRYFAERGERPPA